MKPILVGQFYKQFVVEQKKTIGWTVVFVESARNRNSNGSTITGINSVVLVRNDSRVAIPQVYQYREVEDLIASATIIVTNAPLKRKVTVPDEPPSRAHGILKKERRRLEVRQSLFNEKRRRMEIIRPLIELDQNLYVESVRVALIDKIAATHKISRECVRQYLCLWWQFGCSEEGLYPRFSMAGQKSHSSRCAREKIDPEKHPFLEYKSGPKPSEESDPGMPMGPVEIQKCRSGARDFLFQPSPDHKLHYRWTSAWTHTKNKYFERDTNPTSPAPSRSQFITAVTNDPKFEQLSAKIVGPLPFARNYRQLTSNSRANVMGPGQLGQLDDVTTKVILVDELSKRPLGIGRFFVLSDSWSRTIAGAHDTLEGSSFEEAKQCLYNSFSDKCTFREAQGLDFDLKYVPCSGVFKSIVTDGGPLGGDLANELPEDVCNVSNAAQYRPDLKSDIESSFHAYLVQVARELPGYNRQKRCRGDDDPKILAYLTPTEFRRILWKWIAFYCSRALKGWLPAEAMGVENPPDPSPYALWNWGVIHCGGSLSEKPPEELYRALLARGEGTLTSRRGIFFKGLIYLLENEGNQAAGLFLSKPVKILYDTKYARRIFVELDGSLVVATLLPALDRTFGGLTFRSIVENRTRLAARLRAVQRNHETLREDLYASIEASKKTAPKGTIKQLKRTANAVSVAASRKNQLALEDQRRADKAAIHIPAPVPESSNQDPIECKAADTNPRQVSVLDFITEKKAARS